MRPFKTYPIFALFILSSACSIKEITPSNEDSHYLNRSIASTKASRIINNQVFDNVGLILKDGKPDCSGTIIKHGVFLTAKHCFSGRQFGGDGLKHFSLAFITRNDSPEHPFIVSSDEIVRIFPDEGFNDLAYILYKPGATIGKVNLAITATNFSNFEDGITGAMFVGFPTVSFKFPQKVLSQSCSLGEISGRYRKFPKSLHYRGDLIDTTCPAYYGNSGGPVLAIKLMSTESGLKTTLDIIGVVAHTFNDETKTQKDDIGTFVDNANFSPLGDAKSLNHVLDLDINSLNDSFFLGDAKKSIGSPQLQISQIINAPAQIPSIFYPNKNFWKDGRDKNQIKTKKSEYESIYSGFESKCANETNRAVRIFNNVINKNNLTRYLNGDEDLHLYIDCDNTGLSGGTWFGSMLISRGMINNLDSDGALACFISHEMSHHLLKHDQIKRNEIYIYRKELDADSLGIALTIQAGYTKDDCEKFLKHTTLLDAKVAGSDDPYPSSYERLQNLKDIVIKK